MEQGERMKDKLVQHSGSCDSKWSPEPVCRHQCLCAGTPTV